MQDWDGHQAFEDPVSESHFTMHTTNAIALLIYTAHEVRSDESTERDWRRLAFHISVARKTYERRWVNGDGPSKRPRKGSALNNLSASDAAV